MVCIKVSKQSIEDFIRNEKITLQASSYTTIKLGEELELTDGESTYGVIVQAVDSDHGTITLVPWSKHLCEHLVKEVGKALASS